MYCHGHFLLCCFGVLSPCRCSLRERENGRKWRCILMFDKEGYNCPKCGASASGRKRRMTNECGQQKRLDDRKKANYIGSPQVFALEQACRSINEAFDGYGCYLVGSCIERPDWRDVDVRFIMPD